MTRPLTARQVCGYDGGDCCAATCQPVTYAQFYGLTAAQVANITSTPNITNSDVTSQLPYSCRRALSPHLLPHIRSMSSCRKLLMGVDLSNLRPKVCCRMSLLARALVTHARACSRL